MSYSSASGTYTSLCTMMYVFGYGGLIKKFDCTGQGACLLKACRT